jgi:histidine phosphotransferase ChpT
MGETSANLAAMIGSRICHDLTSPIGAINNGLELLDLTGAAQGPEMDLIADSAGNAGARIRFFRIAYGAAGDQALGRQEVVSLLEDVARGGRLTLRWRIETAQPRAMVRLAFLALQCCETAMPCGGRVEIAIENHRWAVSGLAGKLNIDPALWAGLSTPGGQAKITPALVQFALLPEVAADLGRRVRVTPGDGQIAISF